MPYPKLLKFAFCIYISTSAVEQMLSLGDSVKASHPILLFIFRLLLLSYCSGSGGL